MELQFQSVFKYTLGIFQFWIFLTLTLATGSIQAEGEFCWDKYTCCEGQPDTYALADWDNCTLYYLCFGGVSSNYSCPEGPKPYFNPVTKVCDAVENVAECSQGTRPTIPQPTLTTTEPGDTTTEQSSNGNCTKEGAYYVPYPGDCSKYMICSGGTLLPNVQKCPTGTLFDPEVGDCNLESAVQCKPICPDSGTTNLPHDKNCTLYWLCTFGVATLKSCPPGLQFDPVVGQCNVEDVVFCPNLCPSDGTANFPHAKNCSLYWLCTFGAPTLKACPPQLLFDKTISQCNVADQVDCDKQLLSAFGQSSRINYKSDDWEDEYSDEQEDQNQQDDSSNEFSSF